MANRDTQLPSDAPHRPLINPRIEVLIGVVCRAEKVLVGRRPAGKPLAGYWEFPGGKVEPNESPELALIRELVEETGLIVRPVEPIWSAAHPYAHGHLQITAWWCTCDEGDARPLAAERVAWVAAEQLADLRFPPANAGLMAEVVRRLGSLKG